MHKCLGPIINRYFELINILFEKKLSCKKPGNMCRFGKFLLLHFFGQMDPSAYNYRLITIASLRGKKSGFSSRISSWRDWVRTIRTRGIINQSYVPGTISRSMLALSKSGSLLSPSLFLSHSIAFLEQRRGVDVDVDVDFYPRRGRERCMVSIYFPFNVKLTPTSYSVFKSQRWCDVQMFVWILRLKYFVSKTFET